MENYTGLSEFTIARNPFVQFDLWYKEHFSSGIVIPEAVSLGTASSDGRVSIRTVLLRDYSESGFTFFTNYNSRKGTQLVSNQNAALLFYWPDMCRQVRIEGVAEKTGTEISENYFRSRPRENQLSAWASDQSTVIPDRQYLEKQYAFYNDRFKGRDVERPPHWGGFRIIPSWFEFWQNDEKRLHDRIIFRKTDRDWISERLAP